MTDPLETLRKAFPPAKVGKLPKITCGACSKSNTKNCPSHQKDKCAECGNYITKAHLHLDYVGHAEITRRLLDADPLWSWEPVAFDDKGLPAVDSSGGMWIRLTVHDKDGNAVSRLGYGDAPGKSNAVKELIGDAIRNAGMRFGMALDLWSKERDDYVAEEGTPPPPPPPVKSYAEYLAMIVAASDMAELTKVGTDMAGADIPEGDRTALRAEFTARSKELRAAK